VDGARMLRVDDSVLGVRRLGSVGEFNGYRRCYEANI